MRLVFEISNLKNATPATVSRAGVLFINETDIGWQPEINSWLQRTQDKLEDKSRSAIAIKLLRKDIGDIGYNVFYRCFQSYIESNPDISKIRHICPMVDMAMIQSLCSILDQLLIEWDSALQELTEEA
jgi:dynein heavy chain